MTRQEQSQETAKYKRQLERARKDYKLLKVLYDSLYTKYGKLQEYVENINKGQMSAISNDKKTRR